MKVQNHNIIKHSWKIKNDRALRISFSHQLIHLINNNNNVFFLCHFSFRSQGPLHETIFFKSDQKKNKLSIPDWRPGFSCSSSSQV